MLTLVATLAGAAWRWWDGRGYSKNWVRLFVCFILATAILTEGLPLWIAGIGGVLFTGVWTITQRQREELDDMLLRWALPLSVLGIVIGALRASFASFLVLAAAGVAIAFLVKLGATKQFGVGRFDSAQITEAASGGVAFGALALSVSL